MSVQVTYPVDALVSFHYYREDATMVPLVQSGRLRIIGDSGAFSAWSQGAPINLGEYAAWVAKWRQHLLWAASLDVIGDPEATWRNWVALRERHSLVTVPTLHAGTEPVWLDRYVAEGVDFLGLGGMAGTGQAPRAFRWALNMFRYARDQHPGVRFHLWGVTRREFLDSLPAYSADSSGILGQSYRYGGLRIFDPGTGKHHSVQLRGRGVYAVAQLLRRTYGVDPATIETSRPDNRATLIQIAVKATQLYAGWLQQRHKVTPPASIVEADARLGPTLHLVSTKNDDLADIATGFGPRLHVAGAQPGRPSDELHVAADLGPHMHVVDTYPPHLRDAVAGDPHPTNAAPAAHTQKEIQ